MMRAVVLLVPLLGVLALPARAPAAACEASRYVVRSLGGGGDARLRRPKRLLRFAQLSDVHLYDDDASPLITGALVEAGLEPAIGNSSAQRFQDEYTDEVLNAMVKTVNACHREDPIELLVATGDNTDNLLLNEVRRFIDNLDGVRAGDTAFEAYCGYTTHDSRGVPKAGAALCTPVVGAGFALFTGKLAADTQSNPPDPTLSWDQLAATRSARQLADVAASAAAGGTLTAAAGLPPSLRCDGVLPGCANARLLPPYYAVFGNHDGAVRGTVTMQQAFQPAATAHGRYFFESQREWINEFFHTTALPGPVGHGFDRVEPARFQDPDDRNDGWYAFDAGATVRLVVLNTLYDGVRRELTGDGATNGATGGVVSGNEATNPIALEQGVLSAEQLAWLDAELAAAAAAGRPVLVFSHHPDRSISDRRLGFPADGGAASFELDELLGRYGTVVAHIAGHTHENVVRPCRPGPGNCPIGGGTGPGEPNVLHGFWRIETASLIDWPQEARIVELFAVPGGWALRLTMLLPDESDPTAALSRRLAIAEATCNTSALLGGPIASGPYDEERVQSVADDAGEAAVRGEFCRGTGSLAVAAGSAADRDVVLVP
jgi:3',5'-cyclic AMP phosphodiesterase CpdA